MTLVSRCQRFRRISNGVVSNGVAKYKWTRLKSAIFDYYLTISQKRCNQLNLAHGTKTKNKEKMKTKTE